MKAQGSGSEDAGSEKGDDFDSLKGPPDDELEDLPDEDLDELPEEDPDELDSEELENELGNDEPGAVQPARELELGVEGDADGGKAAAASQETVEADTRVLADREAAREAALAGLRARAAEQAAKRGVEATAATDAPVAAPAGSPATEADAASEVEHEGPPPSAAAPPAKPAEVPALPPGDEKPPRRGLWARFLAGSLLITVAMTTATAVSLLVYLKGIARGLGGLGEPVQAQLAAADPGKPQTILILGSDKRPKGQVVAHSDTTILLRVAADQITVLSIPRDLKVNIPGHGIDKFNAAYTYGGPKLTLKVVKQLTGLDNINHVVNVDFNGFADAVNSIGCVYVDVDHHYYHSNIGLGVAEQYAEIDVPAGYQRMCGYNALQYVRYRHDDNDLVRAARQQQFLREARQELPAKKLLDDRSTLIGILKKYVTSDIEDPTTLVSLGRLFLGARNAPVVQVHFPANLGGPTAAYVTTSESAIKQAVAKFEGVTTPTPPKPPKPSSEGGSKSKGGSGKKPAPAPPPLIDSSVLAQQYAAKLDATKTKSGRRMLDLPVYYPTKLAPGSTISADSRAFPIDGPGNDVYHGYKIVASIPTAGYTADSRKPRRDEDDRRSGLPGVLGRVPAAARRLEDRFGLVLDRQLPAEHPLAWPAARDRRVAAQVHRVSA
jgi:LCP family protein required for cell wall assembly